MWSPVLPRPRVLGAVRYARHHWGRATPARARGLLNRPSKFGGGSPEQLRRPPPKRSLADNLHSSHWAAWPADSSWVDFVAPTLLYHRSQLPWSWQISPQVAMAQRVMNTASPRPIWSAALPSMSRRPLPPSQRSMSDQRGLRPRPVQTAVPQHQRQGDVHQGPARSSG